MLLSLNRDNWLLGRGRRCLLFSSNHFDWLLRGNNSCRLLSSNYNGRLLRGHYNSRLLRDHYRSRLLRSHYSCRLLSCYHSDGLLIVHLLAIDELFGGLPGNDGGLGVGIFLIVNLLDNVEVVASLHLSEIKGLQLVCIFFENIEKLVQIVEIKIHVIDVGLIEISLDNSRDFGLLVVVSS